MRILEEISSKLFWLFLTLLLLTGGYVFIVKNFLNPPKIASIPNVTTAPTKPTTPNIQPNSARDISPPETKPSTPETNPETNPNDWQPELETTSKQNTQEVAKIRELKPPSERIISIPKKLKRGAILSIYENEIEETNPEPHLYQPKLVLEIPALRFAGWFHLRNEFQEVRGFFYVPSDGTYNFSVANISHLKDKYLERIFLSLSIDGITFPSREGGQINLESGWHLINFYFNPQPQIADSNVRITRVNVNWSQLGEPLKPLVVYREFTEKNTQASGAQPEKK